MKPHAYYNEIDPYAAAWLRELIKQGLIADGTVDTRSIAEVQPGDLSGYTQCHFFAGIGVWSYALRNAGWSDSRLVWTGSCPCQPFSSAAGKRKGKDDERHLWPHFFRLIRQCRPSVVFGEQVASADGLDWLDAVSADLESADYATAAADLCAAGVGAPHVRQRLYWVADAGMPQRQTDGLSGGVDTKNAATWDGGASGGLADAENLRHKRSGNAWGGRPRSTDQRAVGGSSATHGGWADSDWLLCRDSKWRPVEPGTFPLVDGATSRVGRLRAYGNAIVPQVAEAFIRAFLKCGDGSAER